MKVVLQKFFDLFCVGLVYFVFGIYYVLLGWWLEPILDWRRQRNLEHDVRTMAAFLFSRYGGRMVPTRDRQRGMDSAFVTVEVGDYDFQFAVGRGELSVRVARKGGSIWHSLSYIAYLAGAPDFGGYYNLRQAADALESCLDRLLAVSKHPTIISALAKAPELIRIETLFQLQAEGKRWRDVEGLVPLRPDEPGTPNEPLGDGVSS